MEVHEVEEELKTLIVETLILEDVAPEQIVSSEPLFGEGLGLDSIDALELAMAVDQRWGVPFAADDEDNKRIFASVHSLAQYVVDQAGPK